MNPPKSLALWWVDLGWELAWPGWQIKRLDLADGQNLGPSGFNSTQTPGRPKSRTPFEILPRARARVVLRSASSFAIPFPKIPVAFCSTVEARKLEYDCLPTPKP